MADPNASKIPSETPDRLWGPAPVDYDSAADTILDDIKEYPEEVREEAADELLEEAVADAPPDVTEDWVDGATAGIAKALGLEHESDKEGEK